MDFVFVANHIMFKPKAFCLFCIHQFDWHQDNLPGGTAISRKYWLDLFTVTGTTWEEFLVLEHGAWCKNWQALEKAERKLQSEFTLEIFRRRMPRRHMHPRPAPRAIPRAWA
jgi:hypothetical protein